MKIILFLLLATGLVFVAWVVLAFVIFVSRALTHMGKPPEWHERHTSVGVGWLHMIGSLALGIWLAYGIVFT